MAKAKAVLFEGVATMFGNQAKGVKALGSGVGTEGWDNERVPAKVAALTSEMDGLMGGWMK